jgi:hypothetical protein
MSIVIGPSATPPDHPDVFTVAVAYGYRWNAALTTDELGALAAGADPATIRPDALVLTTLPTR